MRYHLRTLLISAMLLTALLSAACSTIDSPTGEAIKQKTVPFLFELLIGGPVRVHVLSKLAALFLLTLSMGLAVSSAVLIAAVVMRRQCRIGWITELLAVAIAIPIWIFAVVFIQSA